MQSLKLSFIFILCSSPVPRRCHKYVSVNYQSLQTFVTARFEQVAQISVKPGAPIKTSTCQYVRSAISLESVISCKKKWIIADAKETTLHASYLPEERKRMMGKKKEIYQIAPANPSPRLQELSVVPILLRAVCASDSVQASPKARARSKSAASPVRRKRVRNG